MLETRDLTIRFGGHVAVNAVSCSFPARHLTAIVGPNGAGKTTYFNLISGQLQSHGGQRDLEWCRSVDRVGTSARTRAGLGRAFQLTNLFPNLTVLENVRLAVQATHGPHRRGLNLWSIWSDHTALTARASEILETVSLQDKQTTPVASLPHGDQRKLEVALLMALDPLVYMFDEPTAGMSADEAPVILNLIRKLKSDKTKTILLVEHKMDVVRELADRIIVLHNGALVADGEPAEVIASPVVQEAYLGIAASSRRLHECSTSHPRRRAYPYRRVPHLAWRRPGCAARPAHHAAGAQWCRQDHHAAHHHGPVARVNGRITLMGKTSPRCPRRDCRAEHRLCARDHGHIF